MYCQNCGKKQEGEENFCTNCGTKYKKLENFNQTLEEEQEYHIENHSTISSKNNISFISGMIALVFFWMPILSIPLAIISIVTGVKYEKERNEKAEGKVLGIISIILSIMEIILVICMVASLINWADNSTNTENTIDKFYEYYDEYFKNSEEIFDIRGYSWIGKDQSALYLNKDKTYIWYQEENVTSDNFYSGTYEFYTGNNAIIYIADNLKEYGITEAEQRNLIQNGNYSLKDYYLIILKCDKVVIKGEEQKTENNTIYYYGFYDEQQKSLDLVNMSTKNRAEFILKEKLSRIDL